MANTEQVAKVRESVVTWNQWRAGQTDGPDLSGANFSGIDLNLADLHGANLRGSNLSRASFGSADLSHADLRAANLRGATFDGSNLSGASLREADLQGVDLSLAQRGLQTEQLAGADLTGAKLPEELTKLYDKLENVNNISESARKLFLAVLAACLYSWLTIATTTDVNLITNRASSPLPIIQTSIPIVGFYWVAPLLLLCAYFYFHFYLQKLWEELGSLPAIFPDGRPLHSKIDPWLLNDLVRSHSPKLNFNRPLLSYLQLWISVLLAWWVVPITMFLFWGRYLPRHDRTGTTFHVTLLVISLTAALCLYRLAVATLLGAERKPFRWRGMLASREGYRTAVLAVAVGVLFGAVSWGAFTGVPRNEEISVAGHHYRQRYWLGLGTGRRTWVPRLMAVVGYSPFLDLTGTEVSQKKAGWAESDNSLDSVAEAQLSEATLRYALAHAAFLAGARLSHSDLSYADLSSANLFKATLRNAKLGNAYLWRARLDGADLAGANLGNARINHANVRGADLSVADLRLADLRYADLSDSMLIGADLQGALLGGADLTYSDLRDTLNLNLEEANYPDINAATCAEINPWAVRCALHWEKAFYNDDTLRALGLPPDHNAKIAAQRKKEQDLQH